MKILAIRGSNLASLAGEFDVDLRSGELRGAGVFAITGPVGAGKSTLLDALCLALYNRTPRFSHSGGVLIGRADEDDKLRLRSNDVRSVLRRGTSAGWAEVDFLGVGDVAYRARWAVRRARGRVDGAVQAQDVTLCECESGRQIGGTNTEVLSEIRDRIGLTFDQFCRSALLAQGDFARFLQSDDRDRAELLERMTGTELYGQLSMAAFARRKESQIELASMRERLSEQKVLSDGDRTRLSTEREALQQELSRLESELAASEKARRWHRDFRRLQKEAQQAVGAADRAASEVEFLAKDSATRKSEFVGDLARFEQSIAKQRTQCESEFDVAVRWLQAQHHREPLSRQWDRWSSVLRRYRNSADETKRIEVAHLAAEASAAAARVTFKTSEKARDEADATRASAESAHEEAVNAVAAGDPDSSEKRFEEVERELEALRAVAAVFDKVNAAKANEKRCVEKAARAEAAAGAATELVAKGRNEVGLIAARRGEAERALRQAERFRSLEQHRQDLVEGEPCPLCGSTDHPLGAGGATHIESDLQTRVDGLVAEEREIQSWLTVAEQDRSTQRALADEAVAEAESFRLELSRLQVQIPASFETRETVEDAKSEWVAKRDAILRERKRIEELRRTADQRHREWMAAKDEVMNSERALRDADAEVQKQDSLLRHQEDVRARAVVELEEVFDDERTTSWRDELARDPDGFLADSERLALDYTRNEEQRAKLDAKKRRLATLLETLHALAEEVSEVHFDAATAALRDVEFKGAETLAELLQREVRRRELLRRREAELADRVKTTRAVLQERRRSCTEHEDNERPTMTEEETTERSRESRGGLEKIRPRRDEVLYELRRDDEARAEVAKLEPLIEARQKNCRTWDELSDLIGSFDGRSFRIYAQSLTLDCLLASANHHLCDLAPRYRLQRVPRYDLDLQVVDLDMGEDVRSVNSLSGGESFLVSLALALGLSSISAATTRVESLFIDEGFGSLDLQTLDSALATLDALQATGRQVGVISHVAGIAERIGAQIQVAPMGSGRSKVIVAQA